MAHLNLRLEKKSRLNEFGSQYYLTRERERERERVHTLKIIGMFEMICSEYSCECFPIVTVRIFS